ncbi:MAG: sugar ABC transporter substrate-binding protein [Thermomicrobiales bacterium]|nr:sugar ABC transporter substrate-binding protein [Thermomicrobiales bacterium]
MNNHASRFPNRHSRRSFLGGAAALGAGAAGVGIQLGDASAQDSTEISMMGWGSELEKQNVDNGLAAFQEQNPDITVDWIHIPVAEDQQVALKTAIAGGTAPDLFWSTPFRDFVALGAAMDVTEYLQADPVIGAPDYFLQPQEFERATVNDKWFGIGSCWVAPHIYYNADLLAEAGIDPPSSNPAEAWTFEEFKEYGRQLTFDADGRHPGDNGFDVDNVRQWGVSWPTFDIALAGAIYSNGGYTWGTDYTAGHGSPESIEAIQAIADLTNVDQIAPVPAVLSQMGTDWQALATGNVAIIVQGSWSLQDIAKLDFNYGCGVLPVFQEPATVLLAHSHCISSTTEHPDEAWRLLAYLSSDEYQLGLIQAGLWLPSHTSLLTPEGIASWMTEGVHPEGYDQLVTDYVANYGHNLFYPAGYAEANEMIVSALDPVWIGAQTAQEALVDSGVLDELSAHLQEQQALMADI